MVVKDKVFKSYKEKYENLKNKEIELWVHTLTELKNHAKYWTEYSRDRYNFAHLKVMFDRTWKVQILINQKSKLWKKEQKMVINKSVDSFINQLYRALKKTRDWNKFAARLNTLEAIPLFIEAIFALEWKVRPYNKYLERELNNFPLKKFPWKKWELIEKIKLVDEKNDLNTLVELLKTIRPIFTAHWFPESFDWWNWYYWVDV
jgi:hypothetical protein